MVPSCEAVLAQLWDLPGGIDFIEDELPEKEYHKIIILGTGQEIYACFPEIRSICVDILQARQFPLYKRMILLGLALKKLVEQDWSAPDVSGWLFETAIRLEMHTTSALLDELPKDRLKSLMQNMSTLVKMQSLKKNVVQEMMDALGISLCDASSMDNVKWRYNLENYEAYCAAFSEKFGDLEYFFENLMVLIMLNLSFPKLEDKEKLWGSYVQLCNMYSFYRFAAVAGCGAEPTRERLFHVLAMCSRTLLHSSDFKVEMRDSFFRNDSTSLAHMAILVSG